MSKQTKVKIDLLFEQLIKPQTIMKYHKLTMEQLKLAGQVCEDLDQLNPKALQHVIYHDFHKYLELFELEILIDEYL